MAKLDQITSLAQALNTHECRVKNILRTRSGKHIRIDAEARSPRPDMCPRYSKWVTEAYFKRVCTEVRGSLSILEN